MRVNKEKTSGANLHNFLKSPQDFKKVYSVLQLLVYFFLVQLTYGKFPGDEIASAALVVSFIIRKRSIIKCHNSGLRSLLL